jgi:putative transposase
MRRNTPLITAETYHIFNRGAHKQPIFTNGEDYRRFQINLYLANHSKPIVVSEILSREKHREPFSGYPTDKSLVEVLGYSLMPNHFHLILRQKTDGGITRFMKKVGVGYSMYFNLKYEHSGTLLQGPFKSSHISSDPYFKWLFAYVHLNPISIVESEWREKGVKNMSRAQRFLDRYKYSSYFDYYSDERPERAVLAYEEALYYIDKKSDLRDLVSSYGQGRVLYRAH